MAKKLIIPRATRINEDEARVLAEIESETGLKTGRSRPPDPDLVR